MPTPDPLTTLKQAHASKRRADDRFRAALLAASQAHPQAELARVIGWTRQRVRQQLLRWKEQES